MGEVYLNQKPIVEDFSYAYVESPSGAVVRVAKNNIISSQNIKESLGYSPANQDTVDNLSNEKADVYSGWENASYDEVTGSLIKTTKYIHTYANGKYLSAIVDKYKQVKVTGYQWDASSGFALCSFYDINDVLISSVQLTKDTQYTDYLVDVPSNAFNMLVNGKVGNAMGFVGLKINDCKSLTEEKANRIAKWVIPNIKIKDQYIISANGKSEQSQTDGELGIVDVSKYQRVIVTGYQYDLTYGFDVCCFYDALGNLISSHQGITSKAKAILTLYVPKDAVILKVTGNRYGPHVYVQAYQVFDVDDLYEAVRPQGKKLITLGDSITALGTSNTGWVKYFIEKTGCELVANVAVNSAVLSDVSGTTYDGNPVQSNQTNNTLGNQVQKIINNAYESPDIIMIAIGTNSGISITKEQIKSAYYDSSNNLIPLANVDRTTNAGAYRWCTEKLQTQYPNAIIFWCTPIMGYQTTRSAENAMAYAESLRIATEYSGQMLIDTIRCGINGVNEASGANGQYLVDGLHPNVNGAKKIGYYNASKVLPFIGNTFTLS